jgi:hypothetical protein
MSKRDLMIAGAAVLVLVLLIFFIDRGAVNLNNGFVPPPNKAKIQAMIGQTENNTSLSPMAKSMTVGSLKRILAGAPN